MFYLNQFLYDVNHERNVNGYPNLEYPRDKMVLIDMVLNGITGHRDVFFKNVLNDMTHNDDVHRAL